MKYYLIFKSFIKIILSFSIVFIIFTPFALVMSRKKKNIKNNFLIVEPKYYDRKTKKLFNSKFSNSLEEYSDMYKKKINIINYYPDENLQSCLSKNLNFINFFYKNYPKYLFFKSDWQDPKTENISLFLFIILKIFEKKTIFYSHSGDPNWINNKIRSRICMMFFDAHCFVPEVYIKKINCTLPMPDFGIPKKRFFQPSINRKNEIFYIGRLPQNDERLNILNFLKKNKIDIKIFGESTDNYLSDQKFYEIYRNYKITINFPKQVKMQGITSDYAFRGRVLDALSHGVLLFDQKNPFMDLFFKENIHYVNYADPDDLLEKINYYKKNYNTEGIKIANNGYNFVKTELNSSKVWKNVFEKIN